MIETERLILRSWHDEDVEPFFAIHQDPVMMEFLNGPTNLQEAKTFKDRANRQIATFGYGRWVCELKSTQQLIGFIGLNIPLFVAHFTPAVELGFRVARPYWGQGIAQEGAKAALEFGFAHANLNEIISYTVHTNTRARHTLDRLGMIQDVLGDFLHPGLSIDHPLALHVLYRMTKNQWKAITHN